MLPTDSEINQDLYTSVLKGHWFESELPITRSSHVVIGIMSLTAKYNDIAAVRWWNVASLAESQLDAGSETGGDDAAWDHTADIGKPRESRLIHLVMPRRTSCLIAPRHASSHLIMPHRTSSCLIAPHHHASSHLVMPRHASSHLIIMPRCTSSCLVAPHHHASLHFIMPRHCVTPRCA